MSSDITSVTAWEALDSRGNPTVACEVRLADGTAATALVPSGASAGSHEAVTLRDGGTRYGGNGVRQAVSNVNEILGPQVRGLDATRQDVVDAALAAADGTEDFSRLGGNATLAVSVTSAVAGARSQGASLARALAGSGDLLLPLPMVNVISGGAHAGRILDFQDFLVIPQGAASFAEAIEWAGAVRSAATRRALSSGLAGAHLDADEGGLGVALGSTRGALDLLTESIGDAGLRAGSDIGIAIDVAASEFFSEKGYHLEAEARLLDSSAFVDELVSLCDAYPIISLEDPLAEDDWEAWADITHRLGDRIQLIGDDLFVTQTARLERGIQLGVANAILVKVNQNGLVSGARAALDKAVDAGYKTIVSARSGETEDTWLADLAVGWSAGQIKVGSTHRSERTGKWNRLLQLEATEATRLAQPLQNFHTTRSF